jgi:hypothetical protein
MVAAPRCFIVSLCVLLGTRPLPAQKCDAPHYRWSAKTTTTLSGQAPLQTTITTILTRWTVPALGPGPAYWCSARSGREREVYTVEGWLRLADTTKDDGDWHLELTEVADDARERCIVVEIPAPRWGSIFANARASIDSALRSTRWRRSGRLAPPVHLRITGAAFYDAEHLHGRKRARAQGHGNCNSSLFALWEIHPLYHVELLPERHTARVSESPLSPHRGKPARPD